MTFVLFIWFLSNSPFNQHEYWILQERRELSRNCSCGCLLFHYHSLLRHHPTVFFTEHGFSSFSWFKILLVYSVYYHDFEDCKKEKKKNSLQTRMTMNLWWTMMSGLIIMIISSLTQSTTFFYIHFHTDGKIYITLTNV